MARSQCKQLVCLAAALSFIVVSLVTVVKLALVTESLAYPRLLIVARAVPTLKKRSLQ